MRHWEKKQRIDSSLGCSFSVMFVASIAVGLDYLVLRLFGIDARRTLYVIAVFPGVLAIAWSFMPIVRSLWRTRVRRG